MSKKPTYSTPGVYIKEVSIHPRAISQVETAVPAFIGYTEKAEKEDDSLTMEPTRISSMREYNEYFGGRFSPLLEIEFIDTTSKAEPRIWEHYIDVNGARTGIDYLLQHELYLYDSLRLFFDNGGRDCYIVSVGSYADQADGKGVDHDLLLKGLSVLEEEPDPTIVTIPDAMALRDDAHEINSQMIEHCDKVKSRVAIVDVPHGYRERTHDDQDVIAEFRQHTTSSSFGVAYYPWVFASIVQPEEVSIHNLQAPIKTLKALLQEKSAQKLLLQFSENRASYEKELKQQNPKLTLTELESKLSEYLDGKKTELDMALRTVSTTYAEILNGMRSVMNLQPTAGTMAGIYARVDRNRGVWKAPANVQVKAVNKPAANVSNHGQEDLNVDVLSGKSVNAVRAFPNEGVLVWGGRTLDGNNNDYRYVNVRRTTIMVEQSIKQGLKPFVFEPNDANTWSDVSSVIEQFLHAQWRQGALVGSTPEQSYFVHVGDGSTMTEEDIDQGRMIVLVGLAFVRPAEFILLHFVQEMQVS